MKERRFLRVQISEGRWKSRRNASARPNPSRFDGRCGEKTPPEKVRQEDAKLAA